MEVEDWEKGDREDYVEVEEEAVRPVADFGEGGGSDYEEDGYTCQPEDYVSVLDALEEEVGLDVKVQVHSCVDGEECDDDSAEEAMVRVEFFVGHARQVLNWAPGFGGQKVVHW